MILVVFMEIHSSRFHCLIVEYDKIYLVNAIELTPSGSSTVHIYTQTIRWTIQWNRIHRTEHI